MDSRLYNCKGLKTLHKLGAKLRKICRLCKDKGDFLIFFALRG